MHGLFCYNIDSPDAPPFEARFRTYAAPDTLKAALESESGDLSRLVLRRSMANVPGKLKWIALAGGVLAALGIPARGIPFAEAYREAPASVWACVILAAAAAALTLAEIFMRRRRSGKEAETAARARADAAALALREQAGIPEDAEKADILVVRYRGDEKHQHVPCPAEILETDLFTREDALCVFTGADVFAFPLEDLKGLRSVDRAFPVAGWNKPEAPSAQKYRDAGVTLRGGLPASLRFCCALDLSRNGEDYRLLFPAYELPVFSRRTGLAAPELPERAR